jgi:hypothetical protein
VAIKIHISPLSFFDYRHWFHQLALPGDVADKVGCEADERPQ